VEFKKRKQAKPWKLLMKRRGKTKKLVQKCLDEVDTMVGLTDVEKSYALDIFKTETGRYS
jgi:hypothetical protein